MGKLIDLTHVFTDNMPVYPGDPCSRLYQCATVPGQGFTDHKIESTMHVGTHMDAPLHMHETGFVIADFPLDKFSGRGVLIDARGKKIIDSDSLDGHSIKAGDVVLIWTGWDKKFRTAGYYEDWPILTAALANALVEKNIAFIGMDTPGPDIDEKFTVHKILLPANILIVENMTGLEMLEGQGEFTAHAYPAKYKADAAPVRAFAQF